MFYHIICFMIVVSVFYYCLYLDLFTVVAYFIKQYDRRFKTKLQEKQYDCTLKQRPFSEINTRLN